MACRRSGRRRHRHPRAATPRSKSSGTLLPQALEGPRGRAGAPGDRQVEELWRSASDHYALCQARYEPVRQQPSRSLPPADPATRATDAPLQIARPSAAIPLRSRSHPEPVPRWAAPRQLSQPPDAARALLRRLAAGDMCLLNPSRPIFDHATSRLDDDKLTVPSCSLSGFKKNDQGQGLIRKMQSLLHRSVSPHIGCFTCEPIRPLIRPRGSLVSRLPNANMKGRGGGGTPPSCCFHRTWRLAATDRSSWRATAVRRANIAPAEGCKTRGRGRDPLTIA